MAAAVPQLDLGQDGDQAYSPSSAPFGLRPAARTPAGRSLLMSNPLFDGGDTKSGADEGEQTPRLDASGKLSDLKGAAGPVSSARKWLAGQARSPAGASLAGSVASPARVSASPVQLPAAAAAHLAADAPTPRLLASAGKLTPRTDTGVAPSPATQFPRSFPVAVEAKAPAATAPTGGLATWLRMSSHLSKPAEAAAEPASPADSDASKASSGSGGARTHTVASLDFNTAEAKPAVDSVDKAAPAAPAPKPATKPAASAQPAVAAAPKTSQSAGTSQPTQAGTERHAAAARTERSSLLALPAVQLLLLCLLLPCLLLAAPLSMRAFDPALAQRYMRSHMPDVAAHIRQLSAATSRHASHLSEAAARSAGRLKATASHHTRRASHHAGQLHAAVVRQAQQARVAAQQAQQAVSQAYHQHLSAARKAVTGNAVPAQPVTKPAPGKPQQQQQQQEAKQAQTSNKKTAMAANSQAAAPKPQPAPSQQSVSAKLPAKTGAPAGLKAPSTAPTSARTNQPKSQPKSVAVPASSPAPAAVKLQRQPAAMPKPQAAASKPQAASASKAAMQPPAVSGKPLTKPQQASIAGALRSQAAAFAAARLSPMWQQLRVRLPFLAPPTVPAAMAEAATPRREVQPSALAAAAAAAVAGLACLAALGMRVATSSDAAAEEEDAAVDEEPAALPAFPTTTPAVGGRASRFRRQSDAVIAEAEEEGLPSVVAPRQRRASALPTATPGTAPRTSRRKSAAPGDVPASPTSTVTTRRRSMRLAA